MNRKPEPIWTEDQKACIDMLAEWCCGRHHLPKVREWGDGVCINYHGDLSTYDFDRLTSLVVLAHRDAIRIQIGNGGPHAVKIIAHKRSHGQRKDMPTYAWHPSLDDLTERCRKAKGEPS